MHPDSHGNVIYYVRVFKHKYQNLQSQKSLQDQESIAIDIQLRPQYTSFYRTETNSFFCFKAKAFKPPFYYRHDN